MIGILDEIALTMSELAGLEISKVTSDLLSAFSEVELKLKIILIESIYKIN